MGGCTWGTAQTRRDAKGVIVVRKPAQTGMGVGIRRAAGGAHGLDIGWGRRTSSVGYRVRLHLCGSGQRR